MSAVSRLIIHLRWARWGWFLITRLLKNVLGPSIPHRRRRHAHKKQRVHPPKGDIAHVLKSPPKTDSAQVGTHWGPAEQSTISHIDSASFAFKLPKRVGSEQHEGPEANIRPQASEQCRTNKQFPANPACRNSTLLFPYWDSQASLPLQASSS